jgi:proline iminopeptidase
MPAKRMTVNGTELAYEEWGRGDPLVCVHGGMGIDSAYLKVPGLTGLAGGGRRLVVYDQRGHGASDRSDPREYTHARWAQDLGALAAGLAPGRFALLGHSYGGFIALEFAVRHPAALSHLVLVGTSAGPVAVAAPRVGSEGEVREFFRARWPAFFTGADKHWEVFEGSTFSRGPFEAAFHGELGRYDLRDRVDGLDVPTLLVVGSEDHYRSDMEWLAGRLPNCRMEVIRGAGHIPFLEQPEAFRAAVGAFLNGPA